VSQKRLHEHSHNFLIVHYQNRCGHVRSDKSELAGSRVDGGLERLPAQQTG
jgi:hypothetical protein